MRTENELDPIRNSGKPHSGVSLLIQLLACIKSADFRGVSVDWHQHELKQTSLLDRNLYLWSILQMDPFPVGTTTYKNYLYEGCVRWGVSLFSNGRASAATNFQLLSSSLTSDKAKKVRAGNFGAGVYCVWKYVMHAELIRQELWCITWWQSPCSQHPH